MATYPAAAVERLENYNGERYNAQTNTLGLAIGGHRVNFVPALRDTAAVCAFVAAASQEARDSAQAALERANAAAAARDLAQRYASAPEDVDAGNGLGSALHYAQKAAKSALEAARFNPANFVSKEGDRERFFGRKVIRSRIDYGAPLTNSWEFAPLQIEAYIGPNGEGAGSGVSIAFVDHLAGRTLHVGMGSDGLLYSNGSRISLSQDITEAISNIAAVLRNELAGKFDKAGGLIAGVTRITNGPGTGNIGLSPGDDRYTGFLDFLFTNGARAGYIGQADQLDPNAPIPIVSEGGRSYNFNNRPTFRGGGLTVFSDLVFNNIGGSVQPSQQVLRPDLSGGRGSTCTAHAGAGAVFNFGDTASGTSLRVRNDDNPQFTGTWQVIGYAANPPGDAEPAHYYRQWIRIN